MPSASPSYTYLDSNGNEIIVIRDEDHSKQDEEDDELDDKMAVDSLNKFFTLRDASPVSYLHTFSYFYSILY